MRLPIFLFLSGFSLAALAATPLPPDLQPLPPPPALEGDPAEPEVTITRETGQTVEEYRSDGRLYMIKVTPAHGAPYYLIDDQGNGRFTRRGTLDSGFRPPQWIIKKF